MVLIVDLRTIHHTYYVPIFMMYFCTKFHMPHFIGSLETAIESTAKGNFHTEPISLFHILHNTT
jgi:hypothetical protein